MKHNILYGIKAVLRTPLKSVFFFLLLAAATAFLSLGVGIWHNSENMLNDADSVFKTAGEFVYTGGYLNNNLQYDPYLAEAVNDFDYDILHMPQVLMSEESRMHRAVVEGYNQDRNIMPYGQYAVLFVDARVTEGRYGWDGQLSYVWDVPYSSRNVQDTMVVLGPQEPGQFTHRKLYAVFGYFYNYWGTAYSAFQVSSFEDIGINDAPCPPVIEILDERATDVFWNSEEGRFFSGVVSLLESANRSISVVVTEDIMAVSQFHMGEYFISEGEFFPKDDEFTCIIPQRIAGQLQLAPGDSIHMSIQYPTEETGLHNGFDFYAGFAAEGDYTVMGIYASLENEETIYIPYVDQQWAGRSKADPILARVVLDNRTADTFIDMTKTMLPQGLDFSWSDQGYAGAIRPVLAMRETALTITKVCLIAFLFILWFFGLFFIYRNRESARILIALGTRASGVLSFFLSGSGFISICASAVGGFIGYLASDNVTERVYASMTNSRDLRFSIESYGLRFEDFIAKAQTFAYPFVITSSLVFVAALIITFIFAATSHASHNPARLFRKTARKTLQKRSISHPKYIIASKIRLPSVSLKYAFRTMLRGGKRSITVPILFAVLLTFLSVFSAFRDRYKEQLGNVYEDIPVVARFTDRRGNRYNRLIIDEEQFDMLESMGFVSDMFRSTDLLIRMDYESPLVDWDDPESAFWTMPYIPEYGSYAYDTFIGQLPSLCDTLTLTNNFAYSPEFMYTTVPDVKFVDGYDWESFYNQEIFVTVEDENGIETTIKANGLPDFLIVSSVYLERYELEPGSTVVFSIFAPDLRVAWQHPFVIGGVFESESGNANVYLPEIIPFSTQTYTTARTMLYGNRVQSVTYETFIFVRFNSGGALLMNTENLSLLRDRLEEHYQQLGELGGSRKWIIIDDKALHDSIDTLTRHIMYMDIAAPLILALLVLLGFIISNLLLKSRTMEIGVLRGIGTSQFAVFATLIIEQLMLSIPGIAIGVLLPVLGGFGIIDMMQVALFTLCYFVGACAATLHTQRTKAIKNLARKEE